MDRRRRAAAEALGLARKPRRSAGLPSVERLPRVGERGAPSGAGPFRPRGGGELSGRDSPPQGAKAWDACLAGVSGPLGAALASRGGRIRPEGSWLTVIESAARSERWQWSAPTTSSVLNIMSSMHTGGSTRISFHGAGFRSNWVPREWGSTRAGFHARGFPRMLRGWTFWAPRAGTISQDALETSRSLTIDLRGPLVAGV